MKNPFTSSPAGGRALSTMQLPWFALRPPPDYGVLTTTGRRTGKTRRRCVRAVVDVDRAYVVAIKPRISGWAANALANDEVTLRVRGRNYRGKARRVGADEHEHGREAYSAGVHFFERLEYRMWRKGRPTEEDIRALHREWFDTGTPLVIELSRPTSAG
jgi:deazaflavin-dependent oxidoreductase (nitroreductase family)